MEEQKSKKFIKLEKQINVDLQKCFVDLVNNPELKVSHFHVLSGVSNRGLKHAPKLKDIHGFTVLVVEGPSMFPHYIYSVCDKADTFNRTVGHNTVLEKAIKLYKEDGFSSFKVLTNCINSEGQMVSDVFRKIANTIACSFKKSKQKNVETKIKLSSKDMELKLKEEMGVVKVLYKHFNFEQYLSGFYNHLRTYKTKTIPRSLTFASIFLPNGDVVSGVTINLSDDFNRELGRQNALLNIISKKTDLMKRVKKFKIPSVDRFMEEKGINQ